MKRRTPMAIGLLLWLCVALSASGSATAQDCDAPNVCVPPGDLDAINATADAINAAADVVCNDALTEAGLVPGYRAAALESEAGLQRCYARLEDCQAEAADGEVSWQVPLWLSVGLRTVATGATSVAAASLVAGLPMEVSVGFLVGGVGAFVVDLVLTIVTR